MPLYRLMRMSDLESFEQDANDEEHAVLVFGALLGTTLTLREGSAAPEYMMDRVQKEVHWSTPLAIPVWEVPAHSD